jgi:competence protein ComEC
MNIWNQLPLLKILIPFLSGILFALSGLDFHVPFYIIVSSFFLLAFFVFRYRKIIKNYNFRWIFGFLIAVFFLSSGNFLANSRLKVASDDYSNFVNANDTLIILVTEPVSVRENSVRAIVEAESVFSNESLKPLSGKVMLYFQKDSLTSTIKYGDRLLVAGSFNLLKEPANPGEFNYKRYLSLRGVHTQGYVKSGYWQVIEKDQGSWFRSTALNIRNYFLNIFRENKMEGNEYGVVSALLLGYTDKLDPDLMQSYASTGVLHVLSVSGMHVGVIFIVLNFLLAFLEKKKWGKFLRTILLLLFIWFYAAITGFSPAVNRAAAMITFVILGKSFGRFTNIYNTLAASALFLLILDPLVVADLGFQLSYISVLGIVILQKPIHKLWSPANWLMKQVWLLVSVSLAAQLTTLPVSLFYFHQFPNYFLITNLLVVPFSNIIIYNAILVLMASPVGVIAMLLAKSLIFMIWCLNSIIEYIEHLPFSTTTGLRITFYEMIFMYFFIISFILFFFSKRKMFLKSALVMAILFLVSFNQRYYYSTIQNEFLIYSAKKTSALGFIQGKSHVLISDSSLISNKKSRKFILDNALLERGINSNTDIAGLDNLQEIYSSGNLFVQGHFIQFCAKRIAIVDKSNCQKIYEGKINLDYLVISGNIKTESAVLLENYKPSIIIIDSSNSLYHSKKWIDDCKNTGITCYSVTLSGAFSLVI